MLSTKITSKGQITLPKAIRDHLSLQPGDEIEFVEERTGYRLKKRLTVSPFSAYRGYLKALEGQDPDELVEAMRGR